MCEALTCQRAPRANHRVELSHPAHRIASKQWSHCSNHFACCLPSADTSQRRCLHSLEAQVATRCIFQGLQANIAKYRLMGRPDRVDWLSICMRAEQCQCSIGKGVRDPPVQQGVTDNAVWQCERRSRCLAKSCQRLDIRNCAAMRQERLHDITGLGRQQSIDIREPAQNVVKRNLFI